MYFTSAMPCSVLREFVVGSGDSVDQGMNHLVCCHMGQEPAEECEPLLIVFVPVLFAECAAFPDDFTHLEREDLRVLGVQLISGGRP